jgi:hypothetical protein
VDEPESHDYLGKFIELNTCVSQILGFNSIERDFSREMAINDHLVFLEDHHPLTRFYIERNKNLKKIKNHFHKKISQVKFFDVQLKFQ